MEREYNLVTYDELPEYMKENEYIRGYYRSEWPLSHAFLSLFSWHNETINIWTHLIGFLTFLGFTLVHLGHVPGVIDLLGNLPWSISLGAVDNNTSCNQANLFSDTKELEKKKIGVKGLGIKKTNEAEHFSWKNDVKVPCGSIVDSGYKDSPLEYNEYVVYDSKIVRIKKNYV